MSDAALLEEIRDRRRSASTEWDEIQSEAKKDRLCVAGQPWEALDPDGAKQRRNTKRPYLALDELGQYINQTVNGVRMNPRGIKFAPTGNGANDKGAEFYQNHVREIEYRSHANVVYGTAFESAVTSSIGWLRICTEREHLRTFNHDLWLKPIVNADQVLPDPNATWPDSSDMKFLFYIEPWARKEFERRFPKAKIKNFTPEQRDIAHAWIDRDRVQVGEYWKLETYTRRLVGYLAPHPQTGKPMEHMALLDELPDGKLPDGVENLREEDVEDSRVQAWITNGIEILDEIEWKGKYIPFVSSMGKSIYVDDGSGSRRRILSLTRLARDPYMLYCYIRTCEAEAIGGVPRSTWVGYRGQFAKPDVWAKANREPVPFLEANERTEATPPNEILPLPQKQPWDPPLQNLEIAAESARRAIQAAMGITPNPTPQQQNNQVSGVAKDRFDSSAQKGSFHFNDNYDLMITRTGVILEDAIPHYLDTIRKVPVRTANDSSAIQVINDPDDPQSIFTKGDYRVTISTGQETESQRAEGSAFVDGLLPQVGMIAQLAGPQAAKSLLAKMVKLKNLGPIGDEIVKMLEPPDPKGPDGKPIPPEQQQLMQQVQQVTQQLQQAQQKIQTQSVKTESAERIAAAQLQFDREKLQRDSETKLAVAELSAKVDRMALYLEERDRLGVRVEGIKDRLHEARENVKDRLHDVATAAVDHHATMLQADQAHQHAKEHLALAPPPVDNGTVSNG